jgi:3D (Asp-Asp-Asp) domain-containing protein
MFLVRIDLPKKGLTTSGATTTGGATSGSSSSIITIYDAIIPSVTLVFYSGVGGVERHTRHVVVDLGKVRIAESIDIANRIR